MTIRDAVALARKELVETSFGDAEFEARQLAAFCLGKRRLYTFEFADEMPGDALKKLQSCIMRRKNHEPLQYIIGEWEFMGLPFTVNENVLIPRADTETLAEAAEKIIAERKNTTAPVRFLLDVCTGSGCIGISIAKRTGVPALLCDISPEAVSVAEKYAERMMHIIMATIIEMWFIGSKLLLVEFAGMGTRATKKRSERKTFGYAFEHMRNI